MKKCFIKLAGMLGLSALTLMMACNEQEFLVSDVSQKDANMMVVLLKDHNIPAEKTATTKRNSVTYSIRVNKKHRDQALKLLINNQLPREHRGGLKEVFANGTQGLIPTKSDESARLVMAMQGEAENLLKIVPRIVDARVIFSLDHASDYTKTSPNKTASVAIIFSPSDDYPQSPLTDLEIKELVSSGIMGLEASDVVVVQKPLQALSFASQEEEPVVVMGSIGKSAKDPSKAILWSLLAITLLALLLASFGIARIFKQKRQSA